MSGYIRKTGIVTCGSTPTQLVTSCPDPVTQVWIGPAYNTTTGASVNTEIGKVGMSGTGEQVIPIAPGTITGVYLPCKDPTKVYILGKATETFNYAIFS